MKVRKIFWGIAFVSSVLHSVPVEVLYTANRQGSLDPCGCTTRQIGGLGRMATWVSKKAKGLMLFDSGDTFFSSVQLNPLVEETEWARAQLIAKSYREIGVSGFLPGERDFALGAEKLKELIGKSGARLLGANIRDKKERLNFESLVWFEKNGKTIAVTGVISSENFNGFSEFEITDPGVELEKVAKQAKEKKADLFIVLSHLGLEADRRLAEKFQPDVILGAHTMEGLETPQVIGKTHIFQPTHEGQSMGSFLWDEGKLKDPRWVDLDAQYDTKNRVAQWIKVFYQEQKTRASKKAIPVSNHLIGKPFIANPNYCKNCHGKQYAFWENTKHASAMLVLYAKQRHFDPDCVGCHALGFGAAEGFSIPAKGILAERLEKKGEPFVERVLSAAFDKDSKKGEALDSRQEPERYARIKAEYHSQIESLVNSGRLTKNYLGVQCEHCHGNRSGHPQEKGLVRTVQTQTCRKCHTPERSPGFKDDWREKIRCPAK